MATIECSSALRHASEFKQPEESSDRRIRIVREEKIRIEYAHRRPIVS